MSQIFTYFIKISDDVGETYYVKTTINEQSNTIAMQLTNLKTSWIGKRKISFLYFHRITRFV